MYEYKILHQSTQSDSRIGTINLPHGVVETPVFMPVGTVGAVKTLTLDDLVNIGVQIILANTYHLYLRPGDKLIKLLGGLNQYIKWNKPILTDSGGYQIFSLGEGIRQFKKNDLRKAKIGERGVRFYSHLDGKEHFMTPERAIKIQHNLSSDIIMAFDECPPATATRDEVEKAVARTFRWYKRCEKENQKNFRRALVPICQGGKFKDLREKSCRFLNKTSAPILAIGGVSVGESKKDIYKVTKWCTGVLDKKRPKYLMGVGYPEDIAKSVKMGIDMFDCVLPTRLARHGTVWVKSKAPGSKTIYGVDYKYRQINLLQSKYRLDRDTLDEKCRCKLCRERFSKSYLRHLLKEREPLGIHLLTVHNLTFVFDLIADIKLKITNNSY